MPQATISPAKSALAKSVPVKSAPAKSASAKSAPAKPKLTFVASLAAARVQANKNTQLAISADREKEIQTQHLTADQVMKRMSIVVLPKKVEHLRVPENRPQEIDAVVSGLRHNLNTMQSTYKARLNALHANVKHETKDTFRAKMEALRAQSKADSDRAVDDAYAQLSKIGKEHPEAQSLIAEAAKSVGHLQVLAVQAIATAINTVLNVGLEAIEAVGNAIKDAAEAIGHGLESAGKAIVSIFSGW